MRIAGVIIALLCIAFLFLGIQGFRATLEFANRTTTYHTHFRSCTE